MLRNEIASIMDKDGRMFEWATKVDKNLNLTSEDKEISEVVDAWAKQIGEKGADPNLELSEYIVRTVNPQIYDVPDELLDSMFDRGSIGEFDDYQLNETPRNTLIVHDATVGGTVDKSYIDVKAIKPTWKFKQVETELKYSDLRRNGYKTIATLTTFAEEALKNKMFFDIFNAVDTAITGGDQLIEAAAANPTQTAMDSLALYLIDRGDNPFTVSLSKYAQAIAKMEGYTTYMSDNMKEDFNKYGLVKFFQGVRIGAISGAYKTGDGQLLLPDKRIFGIAGKIGTLDMRGDIRALETMDNKREVVELKLTGFQFGYAINDIEKVAKITLS